MCAQPPCFPVSKPKPQTSLEAHPTSVTQTKLHAAAELVRRAALEDKRGRVVLNNPAAVKDFLTCHFLGYEEERFTALWLDAQNRVITFEELFRGTLTQTSVYPREVVKAALQHNAAGVIFSHNHSSGVAEPNIADEALTRALKQALGLVDVRVVDHMVVAGGQVIGFAERGLL